MKINELIVLGSGTSTGIPMVGCSCPVCTSTDPKNQRLRSSLYLNLKGVQLLIDTTPDLRTQLLTASIDHLDGVIITHDHADHLHGLDDLRPLSFKGQDPLPLFTDDQTATSIAQRFSYIFHPTRPSLGGGRPRLALQHLIVPDGQLATHEIVTKQFHFFKLPHGHGTTLGFQVDTMAYLIDCHEIPDQVVHYLRDQELDLLLIDCCQKDDHRTHLSQPRSFDYIQRIAPQRAGLIHMNHSLEHHELARDAQDFFPFPVFPLYDGQTLTFPSK